MRAVLCAAALVAPAPAIASEDEQLWIGTSAWGPVSGELGVWAEAQVRVTDGASRVGVRNARIGLGWEANRDLSLYGGYAWFRLTPAGRAAVTEHRTWQQALYTLATPGTVRVVGRTRLEQRWREGQGGTSLRVRQMLRVVVPLGRPTQPALVASTEAFAELADTAWIDSGADQLRSFAGVSVPLRPKVALEVGYLNQAPLQRGRAGPNDIGLANLVIRF